MVKCIFQQNLSKSTQKPPYDFIGDWLFLRVAEEVPFLSKLVVSEHVLITFEICMEVNFCWARKQVSMCSSFYIKLYAGMNKHLGYKKLQQQQHHLGLADYDAHSQNLKEKWAQRKIEGSYIGLKNGKTYQNLVVCILLCKQGIAIRRLPNKKQKNKKKIRNTFCFTWINAHGILAGGCSSRSTEKNWKFSGEYKEPLLFRKWHCAKVCLQTNI